MLKRVTDPQTSHVLGLLAILYIAIGMPLIHPALHEHSAHDPNCTCHSVDHFEPADVKKEEHCCPICNFLATNLFHQSVSTLSIETNGPLIGPAPFVQLPAVKTFSSLGEPRAPPPPHRVSQAFHLAG